MYCMCHWTTHTGYIHVTELHTLGTYMSLNYTHWVLTCHWTTNTGYNTVYSHWAIHTGYIQYIIICHWTTNTGYNTVYVTELHTLGTYNTVYVTELHTLGNLWRPLLPRPEGCRAGGAAPCTPPTGRAADCCCCCCSCNCCKLLVQQPLLLVDTINRQREQDCGNIWYLKCRL